MFTPPGNPRPGRPRVGGDWAENFMKLFKALDKVDPFDPLLGDREIEQKREITT
jgi:hypothetical protein